MITGSISLLAGLIFGLGLLLSGMSNPAKVLGFLDLGGRWDPSLALVMAGAIAVSGVTFVYARRMHGSLSGAPMRLPTATTYPRPRLLRRKSLKTCKRRWSSSN